jgi:hypothetical protein
MVFKALSSPRERQPLLQPSATQDIGDSEEPNIPEEYSPPANKYSTADICWILAGTWSGVFLGALDGWS